MHLSYISFILKCVWMRKTTRINFVQTKDVRLVSFSSNIGRSHHLPNQIKGCWILHQRAVLHLPQMLIKSYSMSRCVFLFFSSNKQNLSEQTFLRICKRTSEYLILTTLDMFINTCYNGYFVRKELMIRSTKYKVRWAYMRLSIIFPNQSVQRPKYL